jgi:hypothetical protein
MMSGEDTQRDVYGRVVDHGQEEGEWGEVGGVIGMVCRWLI